MDNASQNKKAPKSKQKNLPLGVLKYPFQFGFKSLSQNDDKIVGFLRISLVEYNKWLKSALKVSS